MRRYVEELQKKTFGKADIRLLEVLGFKDTLRILTEEKTKQLAIDEQMNRRARLEGGTLGNWRQDEKNYDSGNINTLGSGTY